MPVRSIRGLGLVMLTAIAAVVGAQDKPAAEKAPAKAPPGKGGLKLVSPGEAAAKSDKADPYAVPDGTPEEIMEFLDNLRGERKRFASRDEAVEHAISLHKAMIAGGDKILAQKTDEDTAYAAAEMKLESLGTLASAGVEGMMDLALKEALAMSRDPREDIAELAGQYHGELLIGNAINMEPADRDKFAAETLAKIKEEKFSREAISTAIRLAEAFEQLDDTTIAGKYYGELAEILSQGGNPGLRQVAELLKASGRRLNLPGNKMEVTGLTLAGEKFDWEQYRGKVVLVDFWATWCGPCVEEMPNVKANYERFHEQGFEVVGISLDDDREALETFLKDNEIPWTNLFAAPKDGEPQQPPTAEYYGVTGIPTAILVDREGKVLSLNARAEALTALLEGEFAKAPVEKSEDAPAAPKK